jgi:hypothetical protein
LTLPRATNRGLLMPPFNFFTASSPPRGGGLGRGENFYDSKFIKNQELCQGHCYPSFHWAFFGRPLGHPPAKGNDWKFSVVTPLNPLQNSSLRLSHPAGINSFTGFSLFQSCLSIENSRSTGRSPLRQERRDDDSGK